MNPNIQPVGQGPGNIARVSVPLKLPTLTQVIVHLFRERAYHSGYYSAEQMESKTLTGRTVKWFSSINGMSPQAGTTNISYVLRAVFELTLQMNPKLLEGTNLNLFTALPGEPTGMNAFEILAIGEYIQGVEKAFTNGDGRMQLDALVNLGIGTGQALGGLGYLLFRNLSFASAVQNVAVGPTATTHLGQATYVAGAAGDQFFGLMFGALGVMGGIGTVQGWKFQKELEGKTDAEKLDFLRSQMSVEKEDLNMSDEALLELGKGKMEYFIEGFKREAKKSAKAAGESEIRQGIIGFQVETTFQELLSNEDALKEIGTYIAIARKNEANISQIKKHMGPQAFHELTQAFGDHLLDRLNSDNQEIKTAAEHEASKLMELVKDKSNGVLCKNLAWLVVGIVGIVVTILGALATLPTWAPIVLVALSLFMAVGMLGLDQLSWKESIAVMPPPGKLDRLLKDIGTGVLFAALAVQVAVGFAIGASPVGLIFSVAVIVLCLCYRLFYYEWKMAQHTREWIANHPTVEMLQKMKDFKGENFNKLPKHDQEMLKAAWLAKKQLDVVGPLMPAKNFQDMEPEIQKAAIELTKTHLWNVYQKESGDRRAKDSAEKARILFDGMRDVNSRQAIEGYIDLAIQNRDNIDVLDKASEWAAFLEAMSDEKIRKEMVESVIQKKKAEAGNSTLIRVKELADKRIQDATQRNYPQTA